MSHGSIVISVIVAPKMYRQNLKRFEISINMLNHMLMTQISLTYVVSSTCSPFSGHTLLLIMCNLKCVMAPLST
jgi:hypothetical protein